MAPEHRGSLAIKDFEIDPPDLTLNQLVQVVTSKFRKNPIV
jgi:hypothetical protein